MVAFRDKCLVNEIYPLHVMWETGPLETIGDVIGDLFTQADTRAGGGLLDGLRNAKDFVLELTASPIGGPMWSDMKENAWRASDHRQGKGAIQLMKQYALAALNDPNANPGEWELHVVAHSAGSILLAHAVEHLCSLGIPFKTLQFFAPAIRIDEFKQYALPAIKDGRCPKPTMYMLTEQQELDDEVGPYGRSLLWLVSNAFEDKRGTPLLGMKFCFKHEPALRRQFEEVIESAPPNTAGATCTSQTHGGFDNNAPAMNAVLTRILGKQPQFPFEARDLDY